MEEEVKIIPINPETFETQDYTTSDQNLLTISELDTKINEIEGKLNDMKGKIDALGR